MNIEEAEIEHKPNQLSGFNGEVTPSLGIIELPVRVCGVNQMVEFTVLDCPPRSTLSSEDLGYMG